MEHVGRYELLIELAKGGMAELYLGRLHGVGGFTRLVAIKRILPHLAEDKVFVDMFLNEGRIAAHLSHPNICQVHELGESEGELFLAMEYLDGVSWDALIKLMPRTPETLRLVAGVFAQACEGLHYAHELKDVDGTPTPVIHRDVSPQNLFVTVDGVAKILDFGVSKMQKDGPRTRTGVLKGKLPYMSPEQIQGEPLDARSDVFALGVCVWEALTGNSLFDRDTDFLIWKAITEAPIPPLVPYGFPSGIDAVIGCALDRDRTHRFVSARALGEALRNAAEAVGGAYSQAEIAEILKARCATQLAERARSVASVVTNRRSQPKLEPSAADTIEDTAGSTVSLRPDSVKISRPAPAARSRRPLLVGVGVVGVVGAIVAVVLVTRGGGDARTTTPTITDHAPTTPVPGPQPSDVLTLSAEASTPTVCPKGKTCQITCQAGSCAIACEGNCKAICVGGHCAQRCAVGATCTFDCLGGTCANDCPAGAACTTSCTGGGCTAAGAATTGAEPLTGDRLRTALANDPIASEWKGSAPPVAPPKKPAGAKRPASPASPVAPHTDGDGMIDPYPKRAPTAAPAEPGSYSIDSTPYATIYLDGTKLGDTPLFNLKVPAGKHTIRAVLQDGRARTLSVTIEAGQATNAGKLAW